MRVLVFPFLAVALSGCLGLSASYKNHVGGYVVDSDGHPIPGALVEFYGVERQTDSSGCFFFGGHLGVPGFTLKVSKDGYDSYRGGAEFDHYEVTVTLQKEGSGTGSKAEWRRLREEELNEKPSCVR
ncbi:carboxypeptidase-like regulatory domain-containing protein [Gammaproteobacteria bacterium AB-CW1]|uniref:Carboxypeptidase-like regulatory domain-containing protein n=1 Tax=Natronospira elongata TaxID=3110268 RepID=A0AAP6JHK0_9GAMM|nr:carboxypeptidase-like regulatory domain-containing protein [Gammaproteobacteria bacterium AB-CW1]